MATTIRLKQGEARTLRFTVTDSSTGSPLDLNTATETFTVKLSKNSSSYVIQKLDADFDKTSAGSGIVKVTLDETDMDLSPTNYYGELKTWFSADLVDKSQDIIFIIDKAINS